MHIDLLETQALPRPTQAGTREVSGRHKAQSLHIKPTPRASKGGRLYKVRFEIQAQDTPQMPQAPDAHKGYPYISPYQRLTIPARQKGGRPQDAVPTYQATGQAQGTAPTYQDDLYASLQGDTPTQIMVPMWERAAKVEGVDGAVWELLNEPTIHLRTLASREKKQGDLLDIPRFIGYTVGAVAVLGLYLIIPLMILLNAILPSTWNRLFIALGILAVGEMLICTVLAKTIPKGTGHVVQENRGDVLVQL